MIRVQRVWIRFYQNENLFSISYLEKRSPKIRQKNVLNAFGSGIWLYKAIYGLTLHVQIYTGVTLRPID